MAKKETKASVTPAMYDAVVSPVITEKSQMGAELNKFTFNVADWATKPQIKAAIESIFSTKVEKVNVINTKGKTKRFRGTLGKRKDIKKAVITLAEGQAIDVTSAN